MKRDGVELPANFTAPVNGELRIGFPAVFEQHPARRPGPNPEPDADRDTWSDPRD